MSDLTLEIINQIGRLALFVIAFTYANHISSPLKNDYLKDCFKGLLFGALVTAAMMDPLKIAEGSVFDMRGGPAILSGILGGPIAALITALIGGYVRYSIIGGPIALGGAVSFALYAVASILIGYYIKNRGIKLSIKNLVLIGCFAFISVLPAFFISVDVATGIAILKKAGLLVLTNNIASTVVVGFFVVSGTRLITYSQRMEKDLKQTARLARIAAETTNGVVITNESGRIEWVNKGFEQISGYSLDEVLGKKPGDVLQGPETDTETRSRISEHLARGEGFEETILNYKKSGQTYWINIDSQPYLDTDGSRKFMSIQTDVTEKKVVEEALLAEQMQLETARSAAESANKAKSAFLAAMSHEIRTPMTAIIGFSELLLAKELDAKTRDEVNHIKSSADALMILINDILDLSKLEAGKYELDQFPFSPAETIDSLSTIFCETNLAVKKGEIELKVIIDADAPDFVLGDKLRLRQVLLNLTGNALKFTKTGSVTIHYGIDASDSMLRFEVIDSGIGIDPNMTSKLFEDFTQADSSITRKFQGTGLGLAICKRLVTLMGGSIGVESKLHEGSKFWFKLPCHQAARPDLITNPVAIDNKPQEPEFHKPLSVLVADDSLTNRMLMKAIITGMGHKTTLANDGSEAVNAVKEMDFDLILMDVRMPELSGPDATKVIRKLPEPKGSIPIVAVTADLMKENRDSYFEAGMNECIGKPINRESLASAIAIWARKDN